MGTWARAVPGLLAAALGAPRLLYAPPPADARRGGGRAPGAVSAVAVAAAVRPAAAAARAGRAALPQAAARVRRLLAAGIDAPHAAARRHVPRALPADATDAAVAHVGLSARGRRVRRHGGLRPAAAAAAARLRRRAAARDGRFTLQLARCRARAARHRCPAALARPRAAWCGNARGRRQRRRRRRRRCPRCQRRRRRRRGGWRVGRARHEHRASAGGGVAAAGIAAVLRCRTAAAAAGQDWDAAQVVRAQPLALLRGADSAQVAAAARLRGGPAREPEAAGRRPQGLLPPCYLLTYLLTYLLLTTYY